MKCYGCNQEKKIWSDNRCIQCVAAKNRRKNLVKRRLITCKKCGEEKPQKARGLCNPCWVNHRHEFPLEYVSGNFKHEPTLEEVDQIIAEQMANLPAWWERERQKMLMGME